MEEVPGSGLRCMFLFLTALSDFHGALCVDVAMFHTSARTGCVAAPTDHRKVLLMKLGLLGSRSSVPRQNPDLCQSELAEYSGADRTSSAAVVAVANPADEARPPAIAKRSAMASALSLTSQTLATVSTRAPQLLY